MSYYWYSGCSSCATGKKVAYFDVYGQLLTFFQWTSMDVLCSWTSKDVQDIDTLKYLMSTCKSHANTVQEPLFKKAFIYLKNLKTKKSYIVGGIFLYVSRQNINATLKHFIEINNNFLHILFL